ncbi:hypothetical protein NQ317_012609 [Molorchus minor]|uniref:Uncharacterized protein n=1 Tax=Molorchus minor TaxID=1323400 RepID=A0ABQ9JJW1_9CUCU|nr:hypothetical protein NQ317_012609 [Molorchus minor]
MHEFVQIISYQKNEYDIIDQHALKPPISKFKHIAAKGFEYVLKHDNLSHENSIRHRSGRYQNIGIIRQTIGGFTQ